MKDKNKRLEEGKVIFFAEFPLCVAENSAHAGSVILDWILSLDSGFIDDNSALNVLFCDLSTLLQSNPRVPNPGLLFSFAEFVKLKVHDYLFLVIF